MQYLIYLDLPDKFVTGVFYENSEKLRAGDLVQVCLPLLGDRVFYHGDFLCGSGLFASDKPERQRIKTGQNICLSRRPAGAKREKDAPPGVLLNISRGFGLCQCQFWISARMAVILSSIKRIKRSPFSALALEAQPMAPLPAATSQVSQP